MQKNYQATIRSGSLSIPAQLLDTLQLEGQQVTITNQGDSLLILLDQTHNIPYRTYSVADLEQFIQDDQNFS